MLHKYKPIKHKITILFLLTQRFACLFANTVKSNLEHKFCLLFTEMERVNSFEIYHDDAANKKTHSVRAFYFQEQVGRKYVIIIKNSQKRRCCDVCKPTVILSYYMFILVLVSSKDVLIIRNLAVYI